MHVHTIYSPDSILKPKDIIKQVKRVGLNCIAITDHNTIKGALELIKLARDYDIHVIVGEEIKTNRGEVIGYFLKEEVLSRDFLLVVEEISEQDGVISIPHPYDKLRRSSFIPKNEDSEYIDCIEVFNSRCIFTDYNSLALEYAKRHNLCMVAGSDAHLSFEIGLSYVICDCEDLEELRKILKHKRNDKIKIYGKKSPFVVHIISKVIKYTKPMLVKK